MLQYVLQYFESFFLNHSENFISLQICDTIGYISLHFNRTATPITYHIRLPIILFYLHYINFSVSGYYFVPHNELLHRIYNIGTSDHLLFTKFLRSKVQECLDKLLSLLEFIQFHSVVVFFLNEWFGYIFTILV